METLRTSCDCHGIWRCQHCDTSNYVRLFPSLGGWRLGGDLYRLSQCGVCGVWHDVNVNEQLERDDV